MKNILLLALIVTASFLNISCKNDKKNDTGIKILEVSKTYRIDGESSSIEWIAYKTTEKVPVKGEFKTIKITNPKDAPSINEAINGVKFSIPVSSLFTNEPTRDGKLKEFFFGVLDNTEFISGEFTVNETESNVSINMNGVTKTIPIDLIIEGQKASFISTLNLNDWNLQGAVESINKACYDLHKGPDGISKTWDEAEIKAIISLKTNG